MAYKTNANDLIGWPGGECVEVTLSGNGNPPDADPARQHTNVTTLWVRLHPDGTWRPVRGYRNRKTAKEAAVLCESAAGAIQLLSGESPDGPAQG